LDRPLGFSFPEAATEVSEQPHPRRGQGAQPRFAGLVRLFHRKTPGNNHCLCHYLARTMLSNSFVRLKSLDIEIAR
jgi:hypothetical protein